MKKVLVVLLLGAALASAHGQGPFQFAANLAYPPDPGSPLPTGQGLFTLDGNTFRYRVDVAPFGSFWTSQIRGPGPDGPVLFDLPLSGCEFPIETNSGSCHFRGIVVVPDLGLPTCWPAVGM